MVKDDIRKKHEAETRQWRDRLNDIVVTEPEKALIRQIIFQREEAYQWRDAFWRVEAKLQEERETGKAG